MNKGCVVTGDRTILSIIFLMIMVALLWRLMLTYDCFGQIHTPGFGQFMSINVWILKLKLRQPTIL